MEQSSAELFASRWSLYVFVAYVALFSSQGLLVKALPQNQSETSSTIIIVTLTELLKLSICIIAYLARYGISIKKLLEDIANNSRLLLLYLIPAFLYCLYNNLVYVNLKNFDLTTYYCLTQFRIVITGLVYQVLFRRQLTKTQWISLFVLTSGCLLKEYRLYGDARAESSHATTLVINGTKTIPVETHDTSHLFDIINKTALLLFQIFCACFAGVYNEYLLKDLTSYKADVILQNMFMYIDSILCNIMVFCMLPGSSRHEVDLSWEKTVENLTTSPLVSAIIVNNAIGGLVAAIFLKALNSILKSFASAIELFVIAFLASIIYNERIEIHTILALILVSSAMVIYARNPVSTASPRVDDRSEISFKPLSTEDEYNEEHTM